MGNFKRGEISPQSILNIDNDYYTGLSKLTNFYVHPNGHLVKRPPLRVEETIPKAASLLGLPEERIPIDPFVNLPTEIAEDGIVAPVTEKGPELTFTVMARITRDISRGIHNQIRAQNADLDFGRLYMGTSITPKMVTIKEQMRTIGQIEIVDFSANPFIAVYFSEYFTSENGNRLTPTEATVTDANDKSVVFSMPVFNILSRQDTEDGVRYHGYRISVMGRSGLTIFDSVMADTVIPLTIKFSKFVEEGVEQVPEETEEERGLVQDFSGNSSIYINEVGRFPFLNSEDIVTGYINLPDINFTEGYQLLLSSSLPRNPRRDKYFYGNTPGINPEYPGGNEAAVRDILDNDPNTGTDALYSIILFGNLYNLIYFIYRDDHPQRRYIQLAFDKQLVSRDGNPINSITLRIETHSDRGRTIELIIFELWNPKGRRLVYSTDKLIGVKGHETNRIFTTTGTAAENAYRYVGQVHSLLPTFSAVKIDIVGATVGDDLPVPDIASRGGIGSGTDTGTDTDTDTGTDTDTDEVTDNQNTNAVASQNQGAFKLLRLNDEDYYITAGGVFKSVDGVLELLPRALEQNISMRTYRPTSQDKGGTIFGPTYKTIPNVRFEYFNSLTGKQLSSDIFSLRPNIPRNYILRYNEAKVLRGEIYIPSDIGVLKVVSDVLTWFYVKSIRQALQVYNIPTGFEDIVTRRTLNTYICRVEDPQNIFPVDERSNQEILNFDSGEDYRLRFASHSFRDTYVLNRNRSLSELDQSGLNKIDGTATNIAARANLLILYYVYEKKANLIRADAPTPTVNSDGIATNNTTLLTPNKHILNSLDRPQGLQDSMNLSNLINKPIIITYLNDNIAINRALVIPLNNLRSTYAPVYDNNSNAYKYSAWINGLGCIYTFLDGFDEVSTPTDSLSSNNIRIKGKVESEDSRNIIPSTGHNVKITVLNTMENIISVDYIDQRLVFTDIEGRVYMSGIDTFSFSNNDAISLSGAQMPEKFDETVVTRTLTPANGFNFRAVYRTETLELSNTVNYNNTLVGANYEGIYQFSALNEGQAISFNNFRIRKLVDADLTSNVFNTDDHLLYADKNAIVDAFYQRGYDRLVTHTKTKRSEHLLNRYDGDWLILPFILKDDVFCAINISQNRIVLFTLFRPRELGGFSEITLPRINIQDAYYDHRRDKLVIVHRVGNDFVKSIFDTEADIYGDYGVTVDNLPSRVRSERYIDEKGEVISFNQLQTHKGNIYASYESVVETLPIFPLSGEGGTFKMQTPKKFTDLAIGSTNLTDYTVTLKTHGLTSRRIETEIPTVSASDVRESLDEDYGVLIRNLNQSFPMGEDFTIRITDKSSERSVIKSLTVRSGG